MFDLKRPCKDCPFRQSKAGYYQLRSDRLEEIRTAPAFQCHKTLDGQPQQCAGLMAVLHATDQPNRIMQVAETLIDFDAGKIDTTDTFDDWGELLKAHKESSSANS